MKKFILILLLILFLFPCIVNADKFHGKIVKKKGDVFIKNADGTERSPEESDYIAISDEEISTLKNGRAVVKFTNGSVTVIGENSTLGIEKPTMFSHIRGKILFAFAKISGPSRMVRTNSAVFGVRATSFIVQKDKNGELLALKEGLVNVESQSGAFEIHKQIEADEFSNFKSEMETGVNDIKKEGEEYMQQVKDEYIAYKRSFLLQPDNVIRINGNRVDESKIDDALKSDFNDFENFAGDILKGYRD